MISPRFYATAFVAVSFLFGSGGCGSGGSSSPSPAPSASVDAPATTRSTYGPLEFTLTTPKAVYKQGEIASFVFTVKNTGPDEVRFAVVGTTQYSKVTQDGRVVSLPRGTAGVSYTKSIPSGQTETYQLGWAQVDFSQTQVFPGKYSFSARFDTPAIAVGSAETVSIPDDQRDQLLGPPPIEITVE